MVNNVFNNKKNVAILFVFIIIAFLVISYILLMLKNNNKGIDKKIHYKYDINKKVAELNLNTIEDYIEYLSELKEHIEPQEIRPFVKVDKSRAKVYKDADMTQRQTGTEIMKELVSSAYNRIILLVVQKEQDWSNLPLTENFRKKFNEDDGCINEIDSKSVTHIIKDYSDIDNDSTIEYRNTASLHNFSFDKKTFSVQYDYIPDDAYEKYSEYNIYYMIYYGAGAYNLDRYNYEFVLDDKGYLDDIIFLGITPVIVEGHDLEHPENDVWHDGDE